MYNVICCNNLDYRLPIPFLGAIAAVLMLLYPVSLPLIFFFLVCKILFTSLAAVCIIYFNFKTSFFLATTAFSTAIKGRILYEALLNSFDSLNITILPPDVTKPFTDIIGDIIVGVPGILIQLKHVVGIYIIKFISLNSGICTVVDSILHHLCSDTVAHDWLSKVCSW